MVAIKGSQKVIAVGLSDTFGTSAAVGVGDKLEVESISGSPNSTELTSNSIGSGNVMKNKSEIGMQSPTVDITHLAGYEDAGNKFLAQFFGDNSVDEVVVGAHEHIFDIEEDFNAEWLGISELKTTTSAIEYPSCTVTSINWEINPDEYLNVSLNMLANIQDLNPAVNDADQLADCTIEDDLRVVVRQNAEFRINAQAGGALSISDKVNGATISVTLQKPQEHIGEIKGSLGNSEPESSSGMPLTGTLTLSRKNQPDLAYLTAHQAGTEFKAAILIPGPIVTGSTRYAYELYFPRLKVITPVDDGTSDAGRNPESITFEIMKADTNPTGMAHQYPRVRIVNARDDVYEAA
jgi:hypothetical protein